MNSFLAALQFLTICPFPSRCSYGEKELGRSAIFFPVVGLIVGAISTLIDWGFRWLWPTLPASVLTVLWMVAVSGGFHMDGLADTADGFLSSRPRERILEIMKDSRTGPMGVIAVVSILLLKTAVLSSVPNSVRWGVVFLMPFAGRCALVMGMALLSYARLEGGLVSAFGKPRWAWTAPVLLIAVSWLTLRNLGLVSAGFSVLSVLVFSLWCRRKIGGFTGDTLGAGCEIAELIPAIVAASWRWPQ